ncbi:MAG TPA: DUF1428 domain-containing protein [Parvularculaceae bacterium]|nr:DUF1428 domain-containing protein [Parvularculaceae bacterium]HNS85832.1 DUF1428 domain-containing protein [Parvularculaceae bacterium]
MPYIDGYVIAVPTANKEAYRAMAEKVAPIFKKHGALRIVEGWGDDVPEGKLTSFSMAVKREPNETVVFSWIEWPSRAARDSGMNAAMEEMHSAMQMKPEDNPFDGKRMIFGGFQSIVER